ncbi:unnamed protein product [Arabidopsis halleri]
MESYVFFFFFSGQEEKVGIFPFFDNLSFCIFFLK